MNTTMKLSEAMRLGSMLRPQIFGTLRAPSNGVGSPYGSCALGSAFEAAGCENVPASESYKSTSFRGAGKVTRITIVPNEWNVMFHSLRQCPECGVVMILQRLIAHVNDDHRWTIARIADWVETIERAQQTDPKKPRAPRKKKLTGAEQYEPIKT